MLNPLTVERAFPEILIPPVAVPQPPEEPPTDLRVLKPVTLASAALLLMLNPPIDVRFAGPSRLAKKLL